MAYPPEEIHRRYLLREEFEPMTFRRRIAHENFAPGLSGKQEHTTTGKQRKDFDGRPNAVEFRHAHVAEKQVEPPVTGFSTASRPP